jgi:hypothetical protein
VDSHGPRWSGDVRQADWIAERLTPWDEYRVTMVVPAGFEAYARVLHPVDTPENGGRLIRWADVAAWSGMPLRRDAQFHSIALPPAGPAGPSPFGGQTPLEGTLYTADAEAIAAIARAWTATPGECWFCVWDGFGRDPLPASVCAGPRVRLPNREYLLYQGPAEAVTAAAGAHDSPGQCANLWWPADRAWCVASEIDLPWTYAGGPRGLIDAILADDRIEALPAAPDDPVSRVEDWVTAWVDDLVDGLLARGEASVSTPRGSVGAQLRRPGRLRRGELRIQTAGAGDGHDTGGGYSPLDAGADLRSELALQLTLALLDLARM